MANEKNNTINYIEWPVADMQRNKEFFTQLLGWQYQGYGPEYCSLVNAGIDGGFYLSPEHLGYTSGNGPLMVIYASDILACQQKVTALGGTIVQQLFDFPGGCRFHFKCPNNNEFAVWSESITHQ